MLTYLNVEIEIYDIKNKVIFVCDV